MSRKNSISSSSESSEFEMGDIGNFLDDLGIGSQEEEIIENDPTFWDELKNAQGANQIGNITLPDSSLFGEELKPPGQNNGGLIYVSAVPFKYGSGYKLIATPDLEHEGAVPVYWVPWKNGTTVYARRSWYENSICEYFMTTRLSGCRFVLTANEVLHIASNAGGALDGFLGSKTRHEVQRSLIGNVRSRRVSIGREDDVNYKSFALVFGMRIARGRWIYKSLEYTLGQDGGRWVILDF